MNSQYGLYTSYVDDELILDRGLAVHSGLCKHHFRDLDDKKFLEFLKNRGYKKMLFRCVKDYKIQEILSEEELDQIAKSPDLRSELIVKIKEWINTYK